MKKVGRRSYVTTVDVDYIAYRAECEKRNSRRQDYVKRVKRLVGKLCNRGKYKIRVFEVDKHTDIDDDVQCHDTLAHDHVFSPSEPSSEQIVTHTLSQQYKTALRA